jgi:hypothetical protein
MINLHVVQAEFGDCLILESSEEKKIVSFLRMEVFFKCLKNI